MAQKSTTRDRAIFIAIIQQLFAVFIGGTAMDYGVLAQTATFAIVAFWGGAAIIFTRRWRNLTRADLSYLRLATLPLCAASYFLSHTIWWLRGY